jgi:hypothetical protein
MRDVHVQLVAEARKARSPLGALERGLRAFIDLCTRPEYHQVLLVDGPAVLGWHAWRALDLQYGVGLLRDGLKAAVAARQLALDDVDTLSHLLIGAAVDGAMLLSERPADWRLRQRVKISLISLLRGVARPPHRAG